MFICFQDSTESYKRKDFDTENQFCIHRKIIICLKASSANTSQQIFKFYIVPRKEKELLTFIM